jgi:CRP/FNR family transcriptional regulator, dissimilatory nitrate respiration regulator
MTDDRMETLRRVPLFDGLTQRELEAVAGATRERRFQPGDEIVHEGQGGVGFFVIADGKAAVNVHGEERGTLGRGDSFGEVALLDESGKRSATITAVEPVRVFGLTAWQFTPLLEQHPGIAIKLARLLARRLREAEERAAG